MDVRCDGREGVVNDVQLNKYATDTAVGMLFYSIPGLSKDFNGTLEVISNKTGSKLSTVVSGRRREEEVKDEGNERGSEQGSSHLRLGQLDKFDSLGSNRSVEMRWI